jgi:hypothetical protein
MINKNRDQRDQLELDLGLEEEVKSSKKTSNKSYDYYEMLSAFHKELRLGSVERAKFWAMKLGYKNALRYLKSIALEETFNFLFLEELNDIEDLFLAIRLFCGARKWWEQSNSEYVMIYMQTWNRLKKDGLLESEKVDSIDSPYIKKIRQHMVDKDYAGFVEDLYIPKYPDKYVKNDIFKQLVAEVNPNFSWYFERHMWGYQPHYSYNNMFHLSHPDADFELHLADDEEMIECDMPAYALDSHTRRGYKILSENWHNIRPNKPLPEGLDLRYSGVWYSIYWRLEAYKQYGRIDVPWEDVKLDPDIFWQCVRSKG